jgi:hypothetical protein
LISTIVTEDVDAGDLAASAMIGTNASGLFGSASGLTARH